MAHRIRHITAAIESKLWFVMAGALSIFAYVLIAGNSPEAFYATLRRTIWSHLGVQRWIGYTVLYFEFFVVVTLSTLLVLPFLLLIRTPATRGDIIAATLPIIVFGAWQLVCFEFSSLIATTWAFYLVIFCVQMKYLASRFSCKYTLLLGGSSTPMYVFLAFSVPLCLLTVMVISYNYISRLDYPPTSTLVLSTCFMILLVAKKIDGKVSTILAILVLAYFYEFFYSLSSHLLAKLNMSAVCQAHF